MLVATICSTWRSTDHSSSGTRNRSSTTISLAGWDDLWDYSINDDALLRLL
jgi:hypothetical protein